MINARRHLLDCRYRVRDPVRAVSLKAKVGRLIVVVGRLWLSVAAAALGAVADLAASLPAAQRLRCEAAPADDKADHVGRRALFKQQAGQEKCKLASFCGRAQKRGDS